MISRGDREGEADDLFLNSDRDAAGKNMEGALKAQEERPQPNQEPRGKQAEITAGGLSKSADGTNKQSELDNVATDELCLLQCGLNHSQVEQEGLTEHGALSCCGNAQGAECCGGQLCVLELACLSQGKGKGCTSANTPLSQISHNGLNRKRTQERIKKENEAFLKRIESVKPTPGLKCSEQLADYKRVVGYLGGSLKNHIIPEVKGEKPASKVPSAGLKNMFQDQDLSSSSTPTPSIELPEEDTE